MALIFLGFPPFHHRCEVARPPGRHRYITFSAFLTLVLRASTRKSDYPGDEGDAVSRNYLEIQGLLGFLGFLGLFLAG